MLAALTEFRSVILSHRAAALLGSAIAANRTQHCDVHTSLSMCHAVGSHTHRVARSCCWPIECVN